MCTTRWNSGTYTTKYSAIPTKAFLFNTNTLDVVPLPTFSITLNHPFTIVRATTIAYYFWNAGWTSPFRMGNGSSCFFSRHWIRWLRIWAWWNMYNDGSSFSAKCVIYAIANNPQSELPDCFVTLAIFIDNDGLTGLARIVWVLSLTEEYLESYTTTFY